MPLCKESTMWSVGFSVLISGEGVGVAEGVCCRDRCEAPRDHW